MLHFSAKHHTKVARGVQSLGNLAPALKSIETGFEDDTVRILSHVSPESVTCGVTVAKFGVLGFLCNDCMGTCKQSAAPSQSQGHI